MNIYEFALQLADRHWFLFLCCVVLAIVSLQLATIPFRLLNRVIRHRNIVAKGWPPAHLDADGDSVKVRGGQ